MSKDSHSTWAEWAPRFCEGCGERMNLTGKHARGTVFRFDVARVIGRSKRAGCNWRPRR